MQTRYTMLYYYYNNYLFNDNNNILILLIRTSILPVHPNGRPLYLYMCTFSIIIHVIILGI